MTEPQRPIPDDAYELPPFEFKLYAHYLRACQETGRCTDSVRQTADRSRMSAGQVVASRDWLEAHGWITVSPALGNQPRAVWITERDSHAAPASQQSEAEAQPCEVIIIVLHEIKK